MSRVPDFDDLVGKEVPEGERQRLRRAHDLLVQAGPRPSSPPRRTPCRGRNESQRQPRKPMQHRTLLLAAALATAAVLGFVLGQSSGPARARTRSTPCAS